MKAYLLFATQRHFLLTFFIQLKSTRDSPRAPPLSRLYQSIERSVFQRTTFFCNQTRITKIMKVLSAVIATAYSTCTGSESFDDAVTTCSPNQMTINSKCGLKGER